MPKPRNRPQQQLKPVFHIFCEGEKTEPNYLSQYIRQKFPGMTLIKVEKATKYTPVQLVEEALVSKQKEPDGEVVYDREGTTKYSDALHTEARQKASTHIKIALSNVCFEVWLLLHFQATVAPYSNYEDLKRRSQLKKHIPNYEKADKREYSDAEITAARKNAKRMNTTTKAGADRSWQQCHQWNPYTNVYELLDAVDAFGHNHTRVKLRIS